VPRGARGAHRRCDAGGAASCRWPVRLARLARLAQVGAHYGYRALKDHHLTRAAHLEPSSLPLGDKTTRAPKRKRPMGRATLDACSRHRR
jgi:hypothetical protein